MSEYAHYLNELLEGLDVSGRSTNPEISNIALDNRKIRPGGLFVALKGERIDARSFIAQVMEKGAVAVLVDDQDKPSLDETNYNAQNVINVKNLCSSLSTIAARFYNQPSHKLKVIGITGTNGKTTIAWYLAQMLDALGMPAGLMGTLGAGPINTPGDTGHALGATGLTTPDALQVQKCLAEMLEARLEVVCLEVSSHGLELGRIAAVKFDTTVYSNLSQDHLDFHQNMTQYAAAKMRLFEDYEFTQSVVNSDDELGRKIAGRLGDQSLTYGIQSGDLRALDIRLAPHGLQFTVVNQNQEIVLNTDLIGEFNVYNLLAVLGTGMAMGFALGEMAKALERCHSVPGRMERLDNQAEQPVVVVDYAHTPDALDKALMACRGHCAGSLAVVFGCGGERDKAKRPEMGRVAQRIADEVFIADDNPRGELPAAIVDDIKRGMSEPAWVLHDRAQAIHAAVAQAQGNDWVLIAGKGHETKQVYADRVIDFDDRVVARQALGRLAA